MSKKSVKTHHNFNWQEIEKQLENELQSKIMMERIYEEHDPGKELIIWAHEGEIAKLKKQELN